HGGGPLPPRPGRGQHLGPLGPTPPFEPGGGDKGGFLSARSPPRGGQGGEGLGPLGGAPPPPARSPFRGGGSAALRPVLARPGVWGGGGGVGDSTAVQG